MSQIWRGLWGSSKAGNIDKMKDRLLDFVQGGDGQLDKVLDLLDLASTSTSTLIKWAKSDEVRDCRGLPRAPPNTPLLLSAPPVKILSLSSQKQSVLDPKLWKRRITRCSHFGHWPMVRLINFQFSLIWITHSVSDSFVSRKGGRHRLAQPMGIWISDREEKGT